jgi:glycosyltransferase involved in cell wall biosynthesis
MKSNSIIITAPSLNTKENVSGISSVTNFIIDNNSSCVYTHFEVGRKDGEKRNIGWFFKLVKLIFSWMFTVASKKIVLIHFNFALNKASIIRDAPLIYIARLLQKKMVIHLHGGEYLTKTEIPGAIRFILKPLFSGKNPVMVLSPIEKEALIEKYAAKNVYVLPNCVDLAEAINFKRTYNNGPLGILFLGRIEVAKGLESIYKGLAILKQKQVPFNFFLAGKGADEKEYIEKFGTLLNGQFHFKSVVSGIDKTNLLKISDVFLLPSLSEGLPMSLLESMSFGIVPVVTSVGSMKYVVENEQNGIILQNDPGGEIAAAIEKFAGDNSSLQRLSINAGEFIFKNYNPAVYVADLNRIYNAAK